MNGITTPHLVRNNRRYNTIMKSTLIVISCVYDDCYACTCMWMNVSVSMYMFLFITCDLLEFEYENTLWNNIVLDKWYCESLKQIQLLLTFDVCSMFSFPGNFHSHYAPHIHTHLQTVANAHALHTRTHTHPLTHHAYSYASNNGRKQKKQIM